MAKKPAETPLMSQYFEMKKKHPDAILLFRVGDFYETFSEDAISASEILGITLTRRANGAASHVELAGFPHHALDTYLPRLVRAGRRVAICEQLEDPKLAKKLVKRGITELITPGVNMSDSLLDGRENNFLGGLHFQNGGVGIAFLDISTGEFLCAQGNADFAEKLLANIRPKELLMIRGMKRKLSQRMAGESFLFEMDDWVYTEQAAHERLLAQFSTKNLKGFGVAEMPLGVIAAGSLLYYLDQTRHDRLGHITSLSRIEEDRYVRLDSFTVRNLELTRPLSDQGKALIDYLDLTGTPMGSRMMRRWIHFPLRDTAEINARLDAVEEFFRHPELREELTELAATVGDVERIASKAAVGRITPREFLALRTGIDAMAAIRRACLKSESAPLAAICSSINPCTKISDRIKDTVSPNSPALMSKGGYIRPGFNEELDQLRSMASSGRWYLDEMVRREQEATGITSLKIGYNNVFGYYIEVRNTHQDKVPADWIRRQTLTQAERYITPELKEYEEKILGAQDKIDALEAEIYRQLIAETEEYIPAIRANALATAQIDCLLAFANAAEQYKYCRPTVDNNLKISITEGRHPVIERRLPPGEQYVANSLTLDPERTQVMMITGPNMSGKSALLRQTALITLMAQIGSFVPADAATIGVVDKIFTRVGASDNISLGESTFMVEMNEAASILNNMSERSLILFDELGRGTSTYDGISIAWAIVEHIHSSPLRPKTLFATHYHELNEMEASFERIRNFNVSVREEKGKVLFMRRLEPGGSAHSFGIHVARLAGMPRSIVRRADAILHQLEQQAGHTADKPAAQEAEPAAAHPDVSGLAAAREGMQLSFFQLDDPLLEQIRDRLLGIDINALTPLEALNTLNTLRSLLTGK